MNLEFLMYAAYEGDEKLRLSVLLEYIGQDKDAFLKWFETRYTRYSKPDEKAKDWQYLLDKTKKEEEKFAKYVEEHKLKRK